MAAAESVEVVARTYHTIDGIAHAEGETYTVPDRAVAETLHAIGFVTITGGTAAPPPIEPRPQDARRS